MDNRAPKKTPDPLGSRKLTLRIADDTIEPVTALCKKPQSLDRVRFAMSLTYFKRYRMEFDLRKARLPLDELPAGYKLLAWQERLLESHAEAKYHSFRCEIDANVFPCLGDREGCLRLMSEIAQRDGFLNEATWLIAWHPCGEALPENCGTIQGIRYGKKSGSIQNIGITPEHRGRGLGSILLAHALLGFQRAGLRRATLEVTAQNMGAMRLYRRFGFRTVKTVYKAVEVAYS